MKIQNDGLFLIYGIILSLITITQRGLDVLISKYHDKPKTSHDPVTKISIECERYGFF